MATALMMRVSRFRWQSRRGEESEQRESSSAREDHGYPNLRQYGGLKARVRRKSGMRQRLLNSRAHLLL